MVCSIVLGGWLRYQKHSPEVRISCRKVRGTSISTSLQFSMASSLYQYEMKAVHDSV